jgi:hypothetical protein
MKGVKVRRHQRRRRVAVKGVRLCMGYTKWNGVWVQNHTYFQICRSQSRVLRHARQSLRHQRSSCSMWRQSARILVSTFRPGPSLTSVTSQSWLTSQRVRNWSSPELSCLPRQDSLGNRRWKALSWKMEVRYAAVLPLWQNMPPSKRVEVWKSMASPARRRSASCSQSVKPVSAVGRTRTEGKTPPREGLWRKGWIREGSTAGCQ